MMRGNKRRSMAPEEGVGLRSPPLRAVQDCLALGPDGRPAATGEGLCFALRRKGSKYGKSEDGAPSAEWALRESPNSTEPSEAEGVLVTRTTKTCGSVDV
ncbi:Hypp436 [Branchiostoma lanceolatum]|uniref:Hypp436 protein n=1 Tax=Branchiostoma lanceolatum TaxID=7740 RepID=A0A8J9YKX1_BRALA|nr:Hypp436 [Branchiostoma lanceolatum]